MRGFQIIIGGVLAGLLNLQCALAEDPSMGPVISDYGPTFGLMPSDLTVDQSAMYNAVFDASQGATDLKLANHELVSVARFLNMHVRAGVPIENINLAVVLHGKALMSALSPAAYEQRFGVANPNAELIAQLAQAKVQFYVCGQSLGFRGIKRNELLSQMKVGLSAMTLLVQLQGRGYALLP